MKHIKGNIFESNADAILHQVNCRGVMGSGVAKQVREKYPNVFDSYKNLCTLYSSNTKELLGTVQAIMVTTNTHIVNLFAQENYGYDGKCYTDYEALRKCLADVNIRFAGKNVAIPYLMACHRGGGDWSAVSKIIEETLTDCDVTLYEYCGG